MVLAASLTDVANLRACRRAALGQHETADVRVARSRKSQFAAVSETSRQVAPPAVVLVEAATQLTQ